MKRKWVGGGKDQTCQEYVLCNTGKLYQEILTFKNKYVTDRCGELMTAARANLNFDNLQCPCLGELDESKVRPFDCRISPQHSETVLEAWRACQSCKHGRGCNKCYNFSEAGSTTVAVCHECSSWGKHDCLLANCTPGHYDFNQSTGECRNDHSSTKPPEFNQASDEVEGTYTVLTGICFGALFLFLIVAVVFIVVCAMKRKKLSKKLIKTENIRLQEQLAQNHREPELGSKRSSLAAEQAEEARLGSSLVVAQASSLYDMHLAPPRVPVPVEQRTFRQSNFRLFYNAGRINELRLIKTNAYAKVDRYEPTLS